MSVDPIDFINLNKSVIEYSKPILIEKITGSKKYSYNFVVPIVGRLVFRFDNSHAWLWNKNISFLFKIIFGNNIDNIIFKKCV